MKYFLWSGIGLVCIAGPFIAMYDPHELWGPVIAGSIGAAAYLIVVVLRSLKEIPSRFEKSAVVFFTLLFVAGYGAYTMTFREMTAFQRTILPVIRTYIGSGVIVADKIHESLLPVLRKFHQQPDDRQKRSLATIFHEQYGPSITDGTFNKYPPRADVTTETDALTFVSFSGDTAVHYICIDTVARGFNSNFLNASGHTGKLQFAATLTRNGVRYERIN